MRILTGLTCALLLSACGGSSDLAQADGTLAPPGDTAQNGAVDGITCDTSEQLLFHIHAHLSIFAGDSQRWLAAGIGIGAPLQVDHNFVYGGSCFSWLHTHDQTGIIHIESPVDRAFTLGDFFDIWGQPLDASTVGPERGTVTAFLNGQPFTADIRTMPLAAHDVLQLDVGSPVHPVEAYTFPEGY